MATTNINIPSLNIVQTTLEWASDSNVYSDKYILWVSDLFYGATDQMQFKKADGVQTFANLDFMPIGSGGGVNSIEVSYFNTTNNALTDSTTYYISQMGAMSTGATSFARVPLPTGTLVSVHTTTWTTTTIPTELAVLRLMTNDGSESYEIANDSTWISCIGWSVHF